MKRLQALLERRAKLIKEARELSEKATAENRDLSTEEKTQFDKLMDDAATLRADVDREKRLLDEERAAAERIAQDIDEGRRQPGGDEGESRELTAEQRMDRALEGYLRSGNVPAEHREEFRALQAEVDTQGGFIVVPEQFLSRLIQNIDDAVYIRQFATVIPVTGADSLGVPSLDTDPADADWTSEIATGNEDSDMSFGKRSLTPRPLAKRIKVSNKLLRVSAMPAESLVRGRLGYKFGVTQEKAFLTGGGANQPLGVFVASTDGIDTSRDISEGNTTTSIQTNGLIAAKYAIKAGYWMNSRWMFHRDGVKQIALLKDGEGQYMWRESVRAGEPDMLLGRPVAMSEFCPNTFTSGSYVGILGDFSNYWIADSLQMQLQRLAELYAETNQVGFIGRLETDGMPVLAEAFARVTLA